MAEQEPIQKVADLAHLELKGEEKQEISEQFNKILEAFQSLAALPTEGVKPMVTPHQENIALRNDKVEQALSRDEILHNAPDLKDGLFKVPPVV